MKKQLLDFFVLLAVISDFSIQGRKVDEIDENVLNTQINKLNSNIRTLQKMFSTYESFFGRVSDGELTDVPECPKLYREPKTTESRVSNLPATCASARKSGIMELYVPGSNMKSFPAYCMLDSKGNGSAWTVILKRDDPTSSFDRSYDEYKEGFGNREANHWLGLKAIHAMTYFQPHELWIHLKADSNRKNKATDMHSRHTHFAIDGEKSDFQLNVVGQQFGNVVGGIDHFKDLVGNRFSNREDDYSYECVRELQASWWFLEGNAERDCGECAFTGVYDPELGNEPYTGIYYKKFNEKHGLIGSVLMAIRPRKS